MSASQATPLANWARSLGYRQLRVTRPLVPGSRVVPRSVAGRSQRQGCAGRARARVAVRDHLRAFGRADGGADFCRILGQARSLEERRLVDPPRAGDVSLAGITRGPAQTLGRLFREVVVWRTSC